MADPTVPVSLSLIFFAVLAVLVGFPLLAGLLATGFAAGMLAYRYGRPGAVLIPIRTNDTPR